MLLSSRNGIDFGDGEEWEIPYPIIAGTDVRPIAPFFDTRAMDSVKVVAIENTSGTAVISDMNLFWRK